MRINKLANKIKKEKLKMNEKQFVKLIKEIYNERGNLSKLCWIFGMFLKKHNRYEEYRKVIDFLESPIEEEEDENNQLSEDWKATNDMYKSTLLDISNKLRELISPDISIGGM